MKTARLVKIIVSSLMILTLALLLAILTLNEMDCSLVERRTFISTTGQRYTEIAREERFDETFKEINIECEAVETFLSSDNGEKIRVFEEASNNNEYRLYPCYRIENNVLYIKYLSKKDAYSISPNPNRVLRVVIPSEFKIQKITVKTGLSTLNVEDLTCYDLEVNSENSFVSAKRLKCDNAKFTSKSADVSLSSISVLRLLEVESFSGFISTQMTVCPSHTSIKNSYGEINLQLPANVSGFILKAIKGRGTFSINSKYANHQNADGHYLYGDQSKEISVKNADGNVTIL